mgnify:CR=1 FL=1
MILYDVIITSLQGTGGVSVLFNELIKRMSSSGVEHKISIFDDYNNEVDVLEIDKIVKVEK